MLSNQLIRRITIPLAIVWIYREYIYYGSYIMIPELGTFFNYLRKLNY